MIYRIEPQFYKSNELSACSARLKKDKKDVTEQIQFEPISSESFLCDCLFCNS